MSEVKRSPRFNLHPSRRKTQTRKFSRKRFACVGTLNHFQHSLLTQIMLDHSTSMEGALIKRLTALAALPPRSLARLSEASAHRRQTQCGKDLVLAGDERSAARLVLAGWLARSRIVKNGKRQIIGFYVPGDVILPIDGYNPGGATTIYAVQDALTCPAPHGDDPALVSAFTAAADQEREYLCRHIVRLGRMTAAERVKDWMLEMGQRLAAAGFGDGRNFPLPITQEMLADSLGLTAVHVNRTLQGLRADRVLQWRDGKVSLLQ